MYNFSGILISIFPYFEASFMFSFLRLSCMAWGIRPQNDSNSLDSPVRIASKALWDDQRTRFYGKLFYEEPERAKKFRSSSSPVTVEAANTHHQLWPYLQGIPLWSILFCQIITFNPLKKLSKSKERLTFFYFWTKFHPAEGFIFSLMSLIKG